MAVPTTYRWDTLLLNIDDTSDPPVEPCGFKSKSIQFTATTGETTILDCENPDDTPWTTRKATTKSMTVSGSGTVSAAAFDTVWRPWMFDNANTAKTIEITVDQSGADGGGTIAGNFILTDFSINGAAEDDAGIVQFEATLTSAGPLAWTAAT